MKKVLFVCLLSVAVVLVAMAAPDRDNKHIVKKGETLSSISRSYGVKVKDIIKANPSLGAKANIRPGQKLIIPGGKAVAMSTHNTDSIYHTSLKRPSATVAVASTPETPYKDEDAKNRTVLASAETEAALATVNSDQPIINSKPAGVSENTAFSLRTSNSNSAEYPGLFNQYSAHGYKVSKTRGAANFLEDNTSGNPYLALYNGAETGTIIKVTNMMNKKSVYVKVVGRVPANDASKEVILKLSNKVATELGALDNKFLVEVAGVQP
jgi:LysM repeat protein